MGQPQIDQRRLPRANVATDGHELAGAGGCTLEPCLQERDFLLTPDDGTSRQQWGDLAWSPTDGSSPLL